YTGTINGRTTLGPAIYQNDTDDNINFTQLTPSSQFPTGLPGLDFYSAANPATGISVPAGQLGSVNPIIRGILPQTPPPAGPIRLPHTAFTYLNLGPIRN